MPRVYLNVPFSEKDEVKGMGAKWDRNVGRWFVTDATKSRFAKWLPVKSMSYNDLSDEQKSMVDLAKRGETILVDACIGSGKTTTIQVLCDELSDKKILYLTYNRLLKLDAQSKIITRGALVTNYDGFAYKCLSAAGIETDVERNIRLFNQHKPATPSYDVLIMDEYQDIREDIADMLMLIKERNPRLQIIAVGDMAQKIYDFSTLNVMSFMSDFLGENAINIEFTKCFRLPADHAAKLGSLWNKGIVGVNTNGTTRVVNSLEEVAKFCADKEPKDLLVLGSRGGDAMAVLNYLETNFPNKFNKDTVYASIKDGEDCGVRDRNDVAIFTTFDSSKGLERRYSVVLDWSREYYDLRSSMPDAKYETLRNLFLVAASRGKELNLFFDLPEVTDRRRSTRRLLSNLYYGKTESEIPSPSRFDEEPLLIPFEHEYSHEKAYSASTMYDFIYAEDVAACYDLLELTPIKRELSEIDVPIYDGLIDLSFCIGNLMESSFFRGHDLKVERAMVLTDSTYSSLMSRVRDGRRISFFDSDATIEDKVLMLAATETRQARYCMQVQSPIVSQEQMSMIKDRLSTEFSPNEEVQTKLEIDFYSDRDSHKILGACDVIKNDTIYELKFTSGLRETHKLQLGFYLCAHPEIERGILWNVRTNEMIEVRVKNTKEFLERTVKAISKGNLSSSVFCNYEPNHTWLNYSPNVDASIPTPIPMIFE